MLTTDAKRMLYVLYQEYLRRRNNGVSKRQAKYFQNAQYIYESFFPNQLLEDVEDTLRELGRNKYLNNLYADDTVYSVQLSDIAIFKMENQTKDALLSIADFISKFIP